MSSRVKMSSARVTIRKLNQLVIVCLVAGFLASCIKPTDKNYDDSVATMNDSLMSNSKHKQIVQNDAKKLALPASVTAQIMPSASALPGVKDNSTTVRFDVSVNNVAAKEFFAGLAQGSGYSLVLSPGVTGNVTLTLKQVTLKEVLDAVSNLYGYHYEKTGYGYTIYPKELETRIFMMDKLSLQRTLQTNTQLNSSGGDLTQATSSSGGGSAPTTPSTVTIQASQKDTFWADMSTTIASLIGASTGKAAVDSPMVQVTGETGMIVVRAYPKDMALVERYISRTQNILGREVIIEAQILDVELSSTYSAGINWNTLSAGGTAEPATDSAPTTGLLSSVYKLTLSGDRNNFNYVLNLISTQGKVSVLSTPRVSALNNQSAIIKVGSDDYYVTNVQSQVTTGSSSDSNTTTSTINLQAFFSGISLYVTPQITEQGEVNLHIHPSVSQVSENSLSVTVDNQESVLPVAKSIVRETDTVVRAKNGQVIILGGLMQSTIGSSASGLPLDPAYSKTLGAATTSHQSTGVKSELVILLRPIFVEDDVWNAELNKTAKTSYTGKSAQEFFNNAR